MRLANHAANLIGIAGRRVQSRASGQEKCFIQLVQPRRCFHGQFEVGDNVILRAKNRDDRPFWSGPLKPDGVFESHQGNIPHQDIIGKQPRARIDSSAGKPFRVYWPTLAEHCILTPRVVTPIYPAECNAIVSMLDIHVSPPPPEGHPPDSPPLEILEAGTGHGALTLHLARAIHAANPHIPPRMYLEDHRAQEAARTNSSLNPSSHPPPSNLPSWKHRRGAVIHSLDTSSKHLKTAKRTVRTFARGAYANAVDFHCTDIRAFLAGETARRGSAAPFLAHVVLDMPDAQAQLAHVVGAMRAGAAVVLFAPQVTQVLDAVKLVRGRGLPLVLDQVVELGAGMTGGRQWDVRVTPKMPLRGGVEEKPRSLFGRLRQALFGGSAAGVEEEKTQQEWFEVCKPKLGDRIVNGGFVGMWVKVDP